VLEFKLPASTTGDPLSDLQFALDVVAAEMSGYFNCSVYLATAGPGIPKPIVAAAGARDRFSVPRTNASANDFIPAGSITKAMTATLLLQYAEAGKLDLDLPACCFKSRPINFESDDRARTPLCTTALSTEVVELGDPLPRGAVPYVLP
jgi:hypothetical protein